MSRLISRAEGFEQVYEAFQQVNFSAFDYTTIKESMLEYLKLYFPEDFNDYIESSELIANIELFAYLGELMAYRMDVNANENFITTAKRKQNILRLAKLISYNPSRNLPARGLVKITSVSCTESVIDSDGVDLINRVILWNDANNPKWKEQFLLVMGKILEQPFGTVSPSDRVQVDDVLFELYQLRNIPSTLQYGVSRYSVSVSGASLPMELVPATLDKNGPYERRPAVNQTFSILYGSDGLGDASDTTGFFMFTKQGTLQSTEASFDGLTPNQTFEVDINDTNEVDVWLNHIDPDTQETLDEWESVDIANAQNIIFNTNENRNKYEIETLESDSIRLVFGDGEFSDIPSGTFQLWTRVSANADVSIPRTAVNNNVVSFTYADSNQNSQTSTFTYSLINSLQNASASEDIEHIRRTAPTVYYTQDRMVNAKDYNNFMLQDPSILKLRTVNRTYAGETKFIVWNDPSDVYKNVKTFGDDMICFYETYQKLINQDSTEQELVNGLLETSLSTLEVFTSMVRFDTGRNPKAFTVAEKTTILDSLEHPSNVINFVIKVYMDVNGDFQISTTGLSGYQLIDFGTGFGSADAFNMPPATYDFDITVDGGTTQTINVVVTGSETFADIIFQMNTAMVGATVSITPEGDWVFVSDSAGPTSSVFITDGATLPLFNLMDGTITYANTIQAPVSGQNHPAAVNTLFTIEKTADYGNGTYGWAVSITNTRMVADSRDTEFWHTNDGASVLTYDSLNSNEDKIVILQANQDANRTNVLASNLEFEALSRIPLSSGLENLHQLEIISVDADADGFPDTPNLNNILLDRSANITASGLTTVSIDDPSIFGPGAEYLTGYNELKLVDSTGAVISFVENGTIGEMGTSITFTATGTVTLTLRDFVYFKRDTTTDPWIPISVDGASKLLFAADVSPLDLAYDQSGVGTTYKRHPGRPQLNFLWTHFTTRYNIIDPSTSNLMDMFIITKAYYSNYKAYLDGTSAVKPTEPSTFQLRSDYAAMLDNAMISDTVLLHPGKIKVLFGKKAIPELQAKFVVVRSPNTQLTDNQVKLKIVSIIRSFFNVVEWDFGESFYFTELAAVIQNDLRTEIDTVVLVPIQWNHVFGDLFQVNAREDEIFLPSIEVGDIEVVDSLNATTLKQNVTI